MDTDMKEASAMTEASGLTDEIDATEHSSGPRRRAQRSPSQDAAIRWADQLRQMTIRAPLQSLFAAFLVGMWVARRR